MGIKTFSSAFNAVGTVTLNDIAGLRIAFDAFGKLYQASLGVDKITRLTDANGEPTSHILILLRNIVSYFRANIRQIWVFDYFDYENDFHIPEKEEELKRRHAAKERANKKIESLSIESFKNDTTFDPLDIEIKVANISKKPTNPTIDSLQKRAFSVSNAHISDLIMLLDCLGIKYVKGIKGYEGEQIAAYLNRKDIVDAVYSGDSDTLAYGAECLIRSVPSKSETLKYTQDDIFAQINKQNPGKGTLENFRKIAVVLGTDNCEKTERIGPKTVIQKFDGVQLTAKQKKAIELFAELDKKDIEVKIVNEDAIQFNEDGIKRLSDWLLLRGFSQKTITDIFDKIKTPLGATKPAAIKEVTTKVTRLTKKRESKFAPPRFKKPVD